MKTVKYLTYFSIATLISFASVTLAMSHHRSMDHSKYHSTERYAKRGDTIINHKTSSQTTLTEAGTDPFATLQEVIALLNADPSTDWKKVNLEALRLHLIQMQDMILNVNVVQSHIDKGFQAVVTATTRRAFQSLSAVLSVHPKQMKAESGWDMQVRRNNQAFILTVTTEHPKEVAKLRGLGYIGVMASGNHHQPHHWAMASGNNPHQRH